MYTFKDCLQLLYNYYHPQYYMDFFFSNFTMTDISIEIIGILKHYFKQDLKAVLVILKVDETISVYTVEKSLIKV